MIFQNAPESEEALLSLVNAVQKQSKWMILMLAGGHFAGAVFDGYGIFDNCLKFRPHKHISIGVHVCGRTVTQHEIVKKLKRILIIGDSSISLINRLRRLHALVSCTCFGIFNV